jgi:hypothetical protein
MKKSILFFALFLFSIAYKAQLTYQWAKSAGSAANSEYGQAIASDPSGNVYVTGAFTGVVDFDPSAGTTTLSSLSGSQDIFLAKYDINGAFLWVKQIAGTNTEKPFDLVADVSGAYLAGIFMGTVDFDPNAGTNNITSLGGGTDGDGFFAKYDVNGNLNWVDRIGSTGNDRVIGIAVDAFQNVYVSGFIGANADMDPGVPVVTFAVSGTYNAFFGKYSSTGAYTFAKQITGGYSEGDDINIDASGNIYLTGSYATSNDFDPSAGTANLSTASLTQLDVFLAKYTSAGLYTYAKQIGGIGVDIGFQVVPDALGNVYLGGVFSSSCDFDPTAATSTLTSAGQGDLFVAKYDVSGNLTWKNGTGGTTNDYCYGLGLDASNNVYITGKVQGTNVDFDPSLSSALITASSSCMYIASYSSAGNYLSVSSPGDIASEGKGLLVNSSLYVTGMFRNTGDFDFSASTANLTSLGSDDIFFAKYNTCVGSPPAQPSAIAGNFTVCSGTSQTYSVVNDPLATSYNWSFPVGWTGSSSTNVSAPTVSTGGIISVVANNACGASLAQTVNITTVGFSNAVISTTNVSCFNLANGSASITLTGGLAPYTYAWSNSQITPLATNLNAGNYSVTVTDANGCSITKTLTITQPLGMTGIATSTNVTCFGLYNGIGAITCTGGTSPYTFLWQPSLNTASLVINLGPGTHTAIVVDANGCAISKTITITQPAQLNLSTNLGNTNCGQSNGSSTVTATGGAGGYTYLWSAGPTYTNAIMSNVPQGAYTVTVKDANNCTQSVSAIINDIAGPNVVVTNTAPVVCFGQTNGGATVTVAGGVAPYNYLWSYLSQTTQNVNNLPGGIHTLTVTDQANCVSTATVNITQPSSVLVTSVGSVTNVNCSGNINGAAQIITSGGFPAYSYLWQPGAQTNSVLTGVSSGNYSCTVTDANGCVSTKTVSITQPSPLIINTNTISNVTCFGVSNGQIATNITGGTPSYTINWIPTLPATQTVTNLSAGMFTLSVNDLNGCTTNSVYTIVQPAQLVVQITSTTASCDNLSGSASINISGGVLPFSYSWTPTAQTSNTALGLPAGNYTVLITDANACVLVHTVSIPFISSPTLAAISNTSLICNGQTATLTASGANTYTWNTSATGSVIAVSPSVTTTYTVSGTNASGCSNSSIITQSVSLCTALNALSESENLNFKIYPNPFFDEIMVSINDLKNEINFSVYNSLGQLVYQTKVTKPNSVINLKELPSGLYFIRSEVSGQEKVLKLIKQ